MISFSTTVGKILGIESGICGWEKSVTRSLRQFLDTVSPSWPSRWEKNFRWQLSSHITLWLPGMKTLSGLFCLWIKGLPKAEIYSLIPININIFFAFMQRARWEDRTSVSWQSVKSVIYTKLWLHIVYTECKSQLLAKGYVVVAHFARPTQTTRSSLSYPVPYGQSQASCLQSCSHMVSINPLTLCQNEKKYIYGDVWD